MFNTDIIFQHRKLLRLENDSFKKIKPIRDSPKKNKILKQLEIIEEYEQEPIRTTTPTYRESEGERGRKGGYFTGDRMFGVKTQQGFRKKKKKFLQHKKQSKRLHRLNSSH